MSSTTSHTFKFQHLPKRPGRAHWAQISKQKTQWAKDFELFANAMCVPKARKGEKRSVHMHLKSRGPIRDRDNLHAMCKVPLDALKRAGLIYDDSPSYITLSVSDESSGITETAITLTWEAYNDHTGGAQ